MGLPANSRIVITSKRMVGFMAVDLRSHTARHYQEPRHPVLLLWLMDSTRVGMSAPADHLHVELN